MQEIWDRFAQFEEIFEKKHSVQQWQEICELVTRMYYGTHACLTRELMDLAANNKFLSDVECAADKHIFGQCGDGVYWKIYNNNLHISGTGPMWNFDSDTGRDKKGVCPLWCGCEFDKIIIHDGVTSIGVAAFERVTAISVMISGSVKKIDKVAFFDAKIEKMMLPETIDILEEGMVSGFSRVLDTLAVSVNIPNIKPFSLFNRDGALAKTVILTGELPQDLTQLVESRVFECVGGAICYPKHWDMPEESFYDRIVPKFHNRGNDFLQDLKRVLTPYEL